MAARNVARYRRELQLLQDRWGTKTYQARNVARYRRELQLLQDRWGTKTYQDPLHNPNLDRYSETCVIKL